MNVRDAWATERLGRSVASRIATGTAAVAAVLTLTAGCGHSQTPVSAAASRQLTADVNRLEAAAAANDSTAVGRAAAQLRAHVTAQQQAGQVTRERAQAVLAQLTNVLADTAVTARTATPSAPPTAATKHGKRKHDGGEGDGQGNGGGDGGGD